MKLVVDTHTHTYASGHAYSTLIENARLAKEHGLEMFCTTDHAESMPGAPHYWFFSNQRVLPRFIEGVAVIRGVESNILNTRGEVDIHPSTDKNLDWRLPAFMNLCSVLQINRSTLKHSSILFAAVELMLWGIWGIRTSTLILNRFLRAPKSITSQSKSTTPH